MSNHPTDLQLRAFVAGEIADDDAVALALHLDDCGHCAARCERLDPVAAMLSTLPDVRAPETLVPAVLEAAERVAWLPGPEVLGGAALLLVAATLVTLAGDPLEGFVATRVVLEGLRDAGDQIARLLLASNALLAGMVLAGAALAAATTLARPAPGPALRRLS